MSLAHTARAYRLREKQKQALARGAEARARLYLLLHRAYVAQGLAEFHSLYGSERTADQLRVAAYDLREEARRG